MALKMVRMHESLKTTRAGRLGAEGIGGERQPDVCQLRSSLPAFAACGLILRQKYSCTGVYGHRTQVAPPAMNWCTVAQLTATLNFFKYLAIVLAIAS
jgi:hypothetical protein